MSEPVLESATVEATAWNPEAVRHGATAVYVRVGDARVRLDAPGTDDVGGVAVRVEAGEDTDAVRRWHLALTNEGADAVEVEVTTYAEVTLRDADAFEAHPAFAKLFVQTAKVEGFPALLAQRRLRSPDETPLWLAHALVDERGSEPGASMTYETDRARFLGRGRTPADPQAFDAPPRRARAALSGTTGAVLDPCLALRRTTPLEPGASVTLGAVWALEPVRDAALEQVGADPDAPTAPPARLALPSPEHEADETLRFANGYGGFTEDGTEYVVHLRPGDDGRLRLPPSPWVNVIANAHLGFLTSERGSQHTWAANSRLHRLTPWHNDPVSDPTGEALYLADGEAVWSAFPAPAPQPVPYEVRHGWGASTYRHAVRGFACEATVFVPTPDGADDAEGGAPVKLTLLRLTNESDRPRRLTLASYARLVLGDRPEATADAIEVTRDGDALLATNADAGVFADRVAFAATSLDDVDTLGEAGAFLGDGGLADPQALRDGDATPSNGTSAPCFALVGAVEIAPGATAEVAFALGEGADEGEALALAARFRSVEAVRAALDAARAWWRDAVTGVQIATPRAELDLMVNGWAAYQNLACRLLGRTAYYQSGGAYGYRDQLQDASAFVYTRPALARRQLLRHAAHQFVEGDVLHWWHPPHSAGIRTRFADDLLWLPLLTAYYVRATGDASVLDEDVRFLEAPHLDEGEDERYLEPADSGTSASVYEHACRALDRSLDTGAHGLPLMGVGDWNDGMNRVGREGRGESVWMGFFLAETLRRWIPLAEARGDDARAARYRAHHEELRAACNDAGWDGGWYRRAFYDSGAVMGSAESDECQIDALAQAWAVLSGVAPAERARQALDALEARLVDEDAGIIRLLTPAFDRTPHDPGYIKGYLPGIRENGGQYTHGVLWAVRALAEAGRCERAAPLLAMLSPVHHARSQAAAERYQTEPYAVAADVYGEPPHVGRGGWTWYTGSAGWLWRVAVESVCGMTVERGDTLALAPCIPDAWPGFRLTYRLPDGSGVYDVRVTRGDALEVRLDGEPVPLADGAVRVPLIRDGASHRVDLVWPPSSSS